MGTNNYIYTEQNRIASLRYGNQFSWILCTILLLHSLLFYDDTLTLGPSLPTWNIDFPSVTSKYNPHIHPVNYVFFILTHGFVGWVMEKIKYLDKSLVDNGECYSLRF